MVSPNFSRGLGTESPGDANEKRAAGQLVTVTTYRVALRMLMRRVSQTR